MANYGFGVGGVGDFNLSYVGTYLFDLTTKPLPTSGDEDIYDCVGFYGAACGAPNPEYRHKVDLALVPNNDKFGARVTWRYYDSVAIAQSSTQEALAGSFAARNENFASQNYFDVSGSYMMNDTLSFRLGVNNIFDREPPLSSVVGTAPGNGNTYPQVYDAFGRYVFMGATVDF
ncbi:hypothetical protein AB8615_08110 [Litorimonas sp. RW-G-Af-16]|uniref:hypothetical protein n=1 Tax=Litorimonas sp. RW-G-Af-16 TaxID=3241168 RepID=UPI003AAAF76D